jgi:cell division septal protein FtsQ
MKKRVTISGNRRTSTRRQRRDQHLLDVKVRSQKATQQRNRRIMTVFCTLTILITGAVALYRGGRAAMKHFLWENPDYQIAEIEVVSDGVLTREQTLAASGITTGQNIFTVSPARTRERLAQLPQVERVEVQRIMPNKISISIVERKPVAWITAGHDDDPSASPNALLIDRSGRLIDSKLRLPQYLHLPVICGAALKNLQAGDAIETEEVKGALDLLRLTSDGALQPRFEIRSIDLSQGYCMIVTDRNRAQITFSSDKIDWQLERLAMLFDHVEQGKRELQTANLMVQRNLPVTYFPINPDITLDEPIEEVPPPMAKTPAPIIEKTRSAKKKSVPSRRAPTIRKALPVERTKNGQG